MTATMTDAPVTIPDDLSGLDADDHYCHAVCSVCYPVDKDGMISLCGKVLPKEKPPPDTPECEECKQLFVRPCRVCGTNT